MANAVVTVLEADGTTETDITILDVGRQAAAASKSIALATEDKAVLDAIETATEAIASQTADVAHDAVDSGNPVKIGGYASAAAPSGVSGDADRVNAWFLRNGAQATVVTAAGALIGGDATNGLDVDVTRMAALVAGEAHVGEIGGKTVVFDWTPSCHTGANTAGDIVATTEILNGIFRKADGTGIIQSITVVDISDQKAAIDIYFLQANSSMGTEDSAPDIDDTEILDVIGFVSVAVADYKDLGTGAVACIRNISLPVKAVSGTDDLYAAIVTTGTPTYAASGLKLRIGVLLD